MVAIIEDELVFIKKGANLHEFEREVVMKVAPDMGELEDPTPWEVQEAIERIRHHERTTAAQAARAEAASQEAHRTGEMDKRMTAAGGRIKELEGMLEDLRHAGAFSAPRINLDDVKLSARDRDAPRKSPRMLSPRTSSTRPTPKTALPATESGEWSGIKAKPLGESDCSSGEEDRIGTAISAAHAEECSSSSSSSRCQMLGVEQVLKVIGAAHKPGSHRFQGTWHGMPVHVWQVQLHPVGITDLKQEFSRFCVAHPAIASIVGACVQPQFTLDGQVECTVLWLLEEAFGSQSLHARLDKGVLSWEFAHQVSLDLCCALGFLHSLSKGSDSEYISVGWTSEPSLCTVLTASNVQVNATNAKLSLLPSLIRHLEGTGLLTRSCNLESYNVVNGNAMAAYVHPDLLYASARGTDALLNNLYGLGVIMLQLLTEQSPCGLVTSVQSNLASGALADMVPKLPMGPEGAVCATQWAELAIRCATQPVESVVDDIAPKIEAMKQLVDNLTAPWVSWEKLEELVMLPLQQCDMAEPWGRRWVQQDFKQRRRAFMLEVAKLASETPVHQIEIRRARCLKDSITAFAAKGTNIWKQPLKVTFIGELRAGASNCVQHSGTVLRAMGGLHMQLCIACICLAAMTALRGITCGCACMEWHAGNV
jgi:hypothetical protein